MKILKRSSALFLAFALIFSMALAPTADAYSEARLDSTNVLAAGESHAGAVNEYGELYTWGSNSSGQ